MCVDLVEGPSAANSAPVSEQAAKRSTDAKEPNVEGCQLCRALEEPGRGKDEKEEEEEEERKRHVGAGSRVILRTDYGEFGAV